MSQINEWREEKRSAYLYRIIATHEHEDSRKQLFNKLADAAEKQAIIWQQTLEKSSITVPTAYTADIRTRLVAWLIPKFTIKKLRFILAAMKIRGMSIYIDTDPGYPMQTSSIADLEHRHTGINSGGNFRAAVFGVNDGLISNMSLLLGVAGANASQHFILLSGIAGLLAGACSMAAGEYISVRSQRELYEKQIALERSELELYPEEEAEELAIIYQARGLSEEEAKKLAAVLISKPEKALATLAREELGLNPDELGSPWGAAISSFISFAIGAFIPLSPFIINKTHLNLQFSITLTALALFSIGAVLSLFTNQSAIKSGLRMLLIGAMAGALTFLIGKLLGITLH
jgi:VIT1/CCC1 family predicted Fe2+/Mn2+ transporter